MRCLYCDQPLSFFKSLGGSSFCSPEHQKLYEDVQSIAAFERLLEFARQDSKPTAGPSDGTAPSTAEPVGQQAKPASPPQPEPPMATFLHEPIAPSAVSASARIDASFEIPESDFPLEPPALPCLKADPQKPASEPADEEPESSRDVRKSVWVASLCPLEQLAVQAAIDTKHVANLAPLDCFHREPRTANANVQWSSPPPQVPGLSQLDAVEFSLVLQAKSGGNASEASFTVGMIGAETPASVAMAVSPAVPPPQPVATVGVSAVPCPILMGVQHAPDPAQPAIFPARLGQRECCAPAIHWRARPPAVAGLPRRAFEHLKFSQDHGSTPVAMKSALTRAGVARAIRQPQAPASQLASPLGRSGILNRVLADVQNAPDPPVYAISARITQWECVLPAEPTVPKSAVPNPVIAARNLTIRPSDTAVAVGITDVTKPCAAAIPLLVPDVPASPRSVAIVINRVARKVQAQVQDNDGSESCAISPARLVRPECLLRAILPPSTTWLRTAVASVGWFHESDCAGQVFPPVGPATRLFSIRFARESFRRAVPVIAFHRTTRQLTLEVCEWRAGLARSEQADRELARFRPSGTSPLSLVALPDLCIAPRAAGFITTLDRFASITNPANRGVAPSVAASAGEHKPAMSLPQSPALGLSFAFQLSSQAALKALPMEPVNCTLREAALRSNPTPVRAQPASMLVLPGSIPVRGTAWRANVEWATLTSHSLQDRHRFPISSPCSVSSLGCFADAVRVKPAVLPESATLRLNLGRPAISLVLGTSAHGVPIVNPLPKRGGPKLPVVTGPFRVVLSS